METIKEFAELFAYIVTILGLPIALYSYIQQSIRNVRDRELGTYSSLDEKYIDYLKMCMENADLDLYFANLSSPPPLNALEKVKQLAMFEILISIFERAFLLYKDHPSKSRQEQWTGWEQFIIQWTLRPGFDELWKRVGTQYSIPFIEFVNKTIKSRSELIKRYPELQPTVID